MSNPFLLSEIEKNPPAASATFAAPNANPFSLQAIESDQRQDLRVNLQRAVRQNPDQAAEADRLGKQFNVAPDVLARNLMDVKLQDAVMRADARLRTSPKLAEYMRTKPWLAQQSHDDVGPLANVESGINGLADRTVLGAARDVGVTALKGAVALPQALVGIADIFTGGYAGRLVEGAGIRFADTQDILDSLYSPAQQRSNAAVKEAQGFLDTLGAMLQNPSTIATTVGQSVPQMLGGAAIGRGIIAVAPKIAPWLAAAFGEGIMGAGSSAAQSREQSDDGLLSAKQTFGAVMSGAGTALFGAVGGRAAQRLGLKDIDTVLVERGVDAASAATLRQGFASAIAKAGIAEGVFEELPQSVQEQLWQNWANDKPLGEGVGKAAAQGLLAGLATGSGFQAVSEAATRLQSRIDERTLREQETAAYAAKMQEALTAAAESKLRQRNPETFRELVERMATGTDGAPTAVYLDAQVLAQSAPELAAALPSVAEQLQAALTANSTVEVPIADVLTLAPGTPLEQVFLQNARSAPDAQSLADVQAAAEQGETFIREESQRVMQQAADTAVWQQSSETVKTAILEQLNTAGRFTPDVNEAYATLQANFFSTMAARVGLTPQQLYDRYQLRVSARQPGGQVLATLDQGEVEVTDQVDETIGLPLNTDGTVTLYHHTSAANADAIKASGALRSAGEPSVYLTTRETPDTGYGDTVVKVRVKPELLQIDDEFPDGRVDYSISVGRSGGALTDAQFNQTPAALPPWSLEKAKGARITDTIKKAAIALSPTAKQARKNYDKLDAIFAKVPDPLASEEAWRKFMSLLVADRDVLGVPYNALRYAQSPEAVAEYLSRLRPDQLASRRAGFELGAKIRQEYIDGRATPVTTGRLLLWAMLSRKAGAYPHEAAYMDLVNGGVDQWIEKAVNGAWTEADSEGYVKWSSEFMASKKGGVSPSAGVTSNANDFGRILLTKMSEKDENGDTQLTRLHNLIADPNVSTDQVRREFFALGDSLGIQNKVLSFALLVTGRWDTLVLDRVQFTHLWGDQYRERAGQRNIYDNGLAAAGEGHFGLAVYEALARGMTDSLRKGYELAGLTAQGDGTLGAFHWDSWLIESSQAIGHPTIEALDTETPRPDLAVRQGKFDTYAYNFEYRADGQYQIPLLDGSGYIILAPAQAAEFQGRINDPKEGVVPKDFKVSQNKSSPWVDAEGVNRGRYDEILAEYGRRADAADVAPAGLADAGRPLQQRATDAGRAQPAVGATVDTAAGTDGTVLEQGPRGTFSPEQLLVTLNENADLSTFLHESGHFFLEVLADLASQPNTPQQIKDDMAATLKWFGVPDLATWNGYTLDEKRPYHERWAESFEQYLFEGKAPNPELQPLFRRFRSWLINVYQSLTAFMRGRNLKVSDEIRQVFDRMVATDEQIAQAEEAAGMLPDFEATNEAIEALQARSLRDLKWTIKARSKALKALEKEAKALRKDVEAEVRAEVEQQPLYKAMNWLKKGETTDPATGDLVKAEKGFRLSTEALAEMYPDTMLGRPDLTRLRGMTGKEGLHPDMVADMFGFESGDQLVRAILDAEPIASVIEGITDQRMLERHGDLATPEAREAAANEAVHNEARARSLATELKSQADMINQRQDTGRTDVRGRPITVNAVVEAAKQFALNLAARRRLKDLKSAAWQHRAAEARAGKRWQQLTAEGKTEEAVQAKRDQLLNNYAAKALQDAQVEVRKTLEFFKRVVKGSDEKIVERGRDPDVVNAMRAILAAYDVAPRLEKSALAYMETVSRNDPAMYSALKPGVDAALLNAKPLTEMTLEELRGLNDELRAMWVLAKRSRQMEVDGNLLDIEEAADELVTRMDGIGIPAEIPGERGAITDKQEAGIKLRFALSILTRVEQWAERLDGRFGGPFLRLVFQPVKDAADRYRTDRVAYRKQFSELLKNVAPFLPQGPIAAPELGYTFGNARDSGAAELLHAILHTGNDSNKRKLLLGRGWATENADGTLDTTRWDAFIQRLQADGVLRKEHYDFAQGVWDLLEQMKPLAQETHRKVFGRYFAEVTANEVVTPFGTYRGGYVPAQTDSRLVKDAKLRELAEGENESMAYAFPSAPSGFTKSRVEYNQPLLLDLRALGQHMDKVLLFSHMQGAVTDVRRLLTNKRVSYALDRVDPGAYEGMLIPWLNRAAKQVVETPVVGDRKLSRFLSAARSRAGMALMFANLSNTFQQITGFSMAAVKVKPGLMLQSTAAFIADPKGVKTTVAEASPYMKDRMLNEVSAMNDAIEEILVNPTLLQQGQAWTQRHVYFMQAAVDNTMSPIIWTAAYNQAIQQGQDERDAVRFADSVVRQTQGTTLPEDISRFESGPGYARLFTQFASYFNMMANTNATAMSQIVGEMGLRKGAGRLLYVALAGLLVPIWVAEAIALAFRGGPEDEEGDGWLDDWLMAVFGLGTLRGLVALVPIVGQAAQLVVNRFNDNPADDKFSLSPAVSLIESTVSAPASVYNAIVEDGNKQKAVRDVAAAATMITGLPIYGVARPIGYLAGIAGGNIEPTGPVDLARGVVTGTASPESKQR